MCRYGHSTQLLKRSLTVSAAQDGLFLDFEATPQTAGAVKDLLSIAPKLIEGQLGIKEYYAFGYNGSQTNYSIFVTYDTPNGQKASVDGKNPLSMTFFSE